MGKSNTALQSKKQAQARLVSVFAGLDYHKKFTVIALGDEDGTLLGSPARVNNDKDSMRQFFVKHPNVECAVESCRGYEWLLEFLQGELGLKVHLVNTLKAKLITQSRYKTDKLDSKAIMQLLAKRYLPTCYQPSPQERSLRERIRWRAHLVRYATRMKVRMHSLIDKENLGVPGLDLFTTEGRRYLAVAPLSAPRRRLLDEHLEILTYFEDLVKQEDSWVRQTVKKTPRAKLLTSIPGVGDLTALLLVCEIGDINRFKTAAQVASYFGLVPRIDSSAERLSYGPITKQGSKHVRWMLIESAWIAIRRSVPLRDHFNKVSERCGRNAASVAVARKLLKIVYRVLRDNKPFNANLVGKQASA